MTYLGVFEGGNFTETWLFPFQLVAYSLVADIVLRFGRDAPARILVGAGMTLGLAVSVGLFTRMNNVAGLLVLAGVCVVFFRRRLAVAASVIGVIAAVGVALTLWLWTGDAVRAAVDQYVRYNLFYSEGTPLGERVASFATLAQLLVSGAVVAAALVMIGAVLMRRIVAKGTWSPAMTVIVVFIGVGVVDALSQMASAGPTRTISSWRSPDSPSLSPEPVPRCRRRSGSGGAEKHAPAAYDPSGRAHCVRGDRAVQLEHDRPAGPSHHARRGRFHRRLVPGADRGPCPRRDESRRPCARARSRDVDLSRLRSGCRRRRSPTRCLSSRDTAACRRSTWQT